MGKRATRFSPPDPDIDDFSPSLLVERVLEILEAAGIPQQTNDRIVELIEGAERDLNQRWVASRREKGFDDA